MEYKGKCVFLHHEQKAYNMNAVSLNNLWNYLQGLSLTASNRKWLSERLTEPLNKADSSDAKIKDELKQAFQQLNEVKAGKRQTRKAEELLYEL